MFAHIIIMNNLAGTSMTTTRANHVPQISEAIANAMTDSVPKDKQKEAVEVFMKENDTFVSLQTGYGRSTIYKLRS